MSAVGTSPLTRPNDRPARRKAVNRGMELLAMTAAAIGVAILAIVVYKIARTGAARSTGISSRRGKSRLRRRESHRGLRTRLPARS